VGAIRQRPRVSSVAMRRFIVLLFAVLLTACEGADLHEAQQLDSPDAYEAFLAKHPQSAEAARLRERIEELRFLRAQREGTPDALREYLQRHPDGANAEKARAEEDKLSFDVAKREDTPDAYQAYLDSHAAGAFVEPARDAKDRHLYLPKMTVSNVAAERINMAADPKGELNGWRITAEVTNGGDRTLATVECAVDYLDAAGKVVQSDTWWAVAKDLGGFPTPPEMIPTLKAGESRGFRFGTAERPEGFADRFDVRVTGIDFRR
jgi:hypothetical protein